MTTAMLVAQLAGPVSLGLALGLLINRGHYVKTMNAMMKDGSHMLWTGCIATVIGLLIVMNHNIWSQDWTVLVTLYGWIGLAKGVAALIIPAQFMEFGKNMMKGNMLNVALVAHLVFGLVFCYYGYMM